jgi:hypothetical protein
MIAELEAFARGVTPERLPHNATQSLTRENINNMITDSQTVKNHRLWFTCKLTTGMAALACGRRLGCETRRTV